MRDNASDSYRVVIEFSDKRDYEEFVREHADRRCSDIGDWNEYRVVSAGPIDPRSSSSDRAPIA